MSSGPGVAIFFATLVALISWPSAVQAEPDASWFADQTAHMTRITGTYINRQYGFSISLPHAATAWTTTPPNPDHGAMIILGDHRTIEVSASYDAALYGSTSALLSKRLRDAGNGRVSRSGVQLGGLPAEQAVIDGSTPGIVVAQWLPLSAENAINYSLILVTTVQARSQDAGAFRQIVMNYKHFRPER